MKNYIVNNEGMQARDAYDQRIVAQFDADCADDLSAGRLSSGEVYYLFRKWWKSTGRVGDVPTKRRVSSALLEIGWGFYRSREGRCYVRNLNGDAL